jgi:hypothetical protein
VFPSGMAQSIDQINEAQWIYNCHVEVISTMYIFAL